MSDSPARIAELLELYRCTHYATTLPNGSRATLRIGMPAPPDIAAWIGADAFAVYLTACNPRSRRLPDDSNAQRMDELRACLRREGARWLEGEGRLPAESWSEPSLLVTGLPLACLDALARDFGQNASVHVRAGERARLRLHRDDWRAQPLAADLERDGD